MKCFLDAQVASQWSSMELNEEHGQERMARGKPNSFAIKDEVVLDHLVWVICWIFMNLSHEFSEFLYILE